MWQFSTWLTSLTQHMDFLCFQANLCCSMCEYFPSFYEWIIFHPVNIEQFAWAFINLWVIGLLCDRVYNLPQSRFSERRCQNGIEYARISLVKPPVKRVGKAGQGWEPCKPLTHIKGREGGMHRNVLGPSQSKWDSARPKSDVQDLCLLWTSSPVDPGSSPSEAEPGTNQQWLQSPVAEALGCIW